MLLTTLGNHLLRKCFDKLTSKLLSTNKALFKVCIAPSSTSAQYKNCGENNTISIRKNKPWFPKDISNNLSLEIKSVVNLENIFNAKKTELQSYGRILKPNVVCKQKNCYSTDCKDEKSKIAARHNYHEEVEAAINEQIIKEFTAGYNYLSMAVYFGRTDVGLFGTQKFYTNLFNEEKAHAMMLVEYQKVRGGHVVLGAINATACVDGCTIKHSLEIALEKEKEIADQLFEIYNLAEKHCDLRTQDFLTSEFIKEQIQAIRDLGNLLALASRIGPGGLSEFLFDKDLGQINVHNTHSDKQ